MENDEIKSKIKIKEESLIYKIKDVISSKILKFEISNSITLSRANTLFTKEPETINWLRGFEKNSVFYDIGANIGTYSIFSAVTNSSKTFAFEPSSANFLSLIKNINANSVQDIVKAFCIGLDNETKLTELYMPDLRIGSSGHSVGEPIDEKLVEVQHPFSQGVFSTTIDELIEVWGLPAPNYIKIDVDNIEHKIIEGAKKILKRDTLKSVLIEMNIKTRFGNKILEELTGNGFSFDEEETESRKKLEGWNEGEANYIFYRK